MSTNHVIAAIDIGTTSCKGLVMDAHGNVLASSQKFNQTLHPTPGFVEQDPTVIFESIVEILKEIATGKTLTATCLSSAMHSLMAVDKNGLPLTPLMIWSDTRSTKQSRDLIERKLSQSLYEITGTPVHPMSPLCKLLWLKENQPSVFAAAYKFISLKEYVYFASRENS
jgi:gluconokinase